MEVPKVSVESTTGESPLLRSSRLWPVVAGVCFALLFAALGWAMQLRSELAARQAESTQALEAHLKTLVLQTRQIEALDQLAARIDRFNREFGASVGRLQVGESLEVELKALVQKPHLPEEARRTLEEFEQSAAAIAEMAATVREYERYLGAPAAVQRGDTHSQIAKRYLLEEAHLTPAEADRVLRRTALAWELEPGNAVYNLFHEGLLLSTVTQGTAKRPPLLVQAAQRQAVLARVAELEEKVRQLEARQAAPAPQ